MKWRRALYLLLIVVVTTLFVMKRFNITFPDTHEYTLMLDFLLGRTDVVANAPFVFRVLVPILAMPFGLFMSSYEAVSMVSMIGSVCLAIVIFYICKEFSEYENDLVAFVVTLVVVGTKTFTYAGASALTDSVAMVFVACIVLFTLRDYDWKAILLLVVVGVFAKELVLFGALFYLLYRRTLQSWAVALSGAIVTVLLRLAICGTIFYAQSIHPLQGWVFSYTVNAVFWLSVLSLLLIVAWVRYTNYVRESLQLFIIGLLAFGPYCLLGGIIGYFDHRFAWPLQIAFLGMASVGLGSSYEAFMRRLKE